MSELATWLSAVGTISVSIVAVYLAYIDNRIILRGTATFMRTGVSKEDIHPHIIEIYIQNLGRRPVRISKFSWTTGIFLKAHHDWFNDYLPGSSDLPITLKEHDTATYQLPLKVLIESDMIESKMKTLFYPVGLYAWVLTRNHKFKKLLVFQEVSLAIKGVEVLDK